MKLRNGCSPRHTIAAMAVFAVALAMSAGADAGVYKCLRDDGSIMYQEDPCPPGKELRDFERDPAPVSVVPFRIPQTDARIAEPRELPLPKTSERKSSKSVNRQGTAAERKFLVPGIGEGEVVARIGRPDLSSGAGRKVVRWTYLPAPDDPQTITTLTFELGRLIQIERKVIHTP